MIIFAVVGLTFDRIGVAQNRPVLTAAVAASHVSKWNPPERDGCRYSFFEVAKSRIPSRGEIRGQTLALSGHRPKAKNKEINSKCNVPSQHLD